MGVPAHMIEPSRYPTKGSPDRGLSRGLSVVLDAMRFAAAMTVFLGHLGEPQFSAGLPYLATEEHLAVAVFFVLSGFVIRYVTLQRESTAGEYLIDRASRIYSVVVPALAITLLCELAAQSIRPGYYAHLRVQFLWQHVPLQIAANLAFQAENWGYAIPPMSNGPFWSLSFECLYYALYGFAFYRIRRRGIWILFLLLLGGPSIALMFPVWWIGCFSYDFYRRLQTRKNGFLIASIFCALPFLAALAFRQRLFKLLILADEPHRTAWLSRVLVRVPHHSVFLFHGTVPWLSQATPTYFVVGALTAAFTTWMALAFDYFGMDVPERVVKMVRVVADSTFALYLLHLPLLILIATALGRQMRLGSAIAAACGIVIACVWLSRLFDSLKKSMRRAMRRSKLPGLLWGYKKQTTPAGVA